jgi:hypothetical protein
MLLPLPLLPLTALARGSLSYTYFTWNVQLHSPSSAAQINKTVTVNALFHAVLQQIYWRYVFNAEPKAQAATLGLQLRSVPNASMILKGCNQPG